jgi:HSP20 family protein
MSNIQPLVGQFLDEFLREVNLGCSGKPLHGDVLTGRMKLDVRETPQGFDIEAEIPGADKQQIHVDIDGNIVTLRAAINQSDRQSDGEKVLRNERFYGELSRRIQLPSELDQQASRARYDNGILYLTLGKKQSRGGQKLVVE